MSRKLTLSLVVLLVAAMCVTAWGAATPRYKMRTTPIEVDGRNELPHNTAVRNYGVPYQVGRTSATPGVPVGFTWYDYQHNGTLGRMVAQYGGKIQEAWMKGDDASPSLRSARWNYVTVTGSAVPVVLDNGGSINLFPLSDPGILNGQPFTGNRPGYVNHRNRPGGKGGTIYHDAPESGGGAYWGVQIDQSAGAGLFTFSAAAQPVGAQYEADGVIWPKGCFTVCGTDTVMHTVASWSGAENELWYWRGVVSGGTVTFSDPVLLDIEPYITAGIEANGTEVSVAYMKANNNTNWDCMLIQSPDCGAKWGTPQNLTNFSADGPEGCNTELALNYDPAGHLHILYSTVPSSGGVIPSNLYHWDSFTGNTRLITSAPWTNKCDNGTITTTGTNNGAGNAQGCIADIGLTIKPAGAGPGAGIADELLYAVWCNYKSDGVDCATLDAAGTLGGYVNGELYWSVSSNGGQTWDRPQNMTGTVTPDCLPGDCASEAWCTVAVEADSGVYVSYVDDTHAGGAVNGEGEWTESTFDVMAAEARLPVLEPVIAVTPTDFIELNAKTSGSQIAHVTVASVGNADLTYTVTVTNDDGGQSHVLVNGSGSYAGAITAGGDPDVLDITYDGVGLVDPSEHHWRLEVTSNDKTNDPNQGGTPIDINMQVFVADVWFTCVQDTISTGQHRLNVSSCLEVGDQGGDSGWFTYADSTAWIYDGSPIITLLDGSSTKRAYRNYYMSAINRTRDTNQSFRAVDSAMMVTRDGTADVARGTAVTTDTTIQIDYEMSAFKDPSLANGAIMKYTMTNLTGSPMNSVDWGAGSDLDVTSDSSSSSQNIGIGDQSKGYIGLQAVKEDTLGTVSGYYNDFMALFHVDFAAGCSGTAAAAQVLDNNDYVYSGLSFPTDSAYALMDRFGSAGSWGTSVYGGPIDTVTDCNVLMVTAYNQTLSPGTPVTWGFGLASSEVSQADLESTIAALRLQVNPDCGACPITLTGDVNTNGSITSSDIIYLVGYVFKGGPAPLPCPASGDVNCNGSVTSSDIIYLVGYVFKGGPPPCDVCTMIPGTWSCP